jgi:hypothetical protein
VAPEIAFGDEPESDRFDFATQGALKLMRKFQSAKVGDWYGMVTGRLGYDGAGIEKHKARHQGYGLPKASRAMIFDCDKSR